MNSTFKFAFNALFFFLIPLTTAGTLLADGYTAVNTSPTPVGYVITSLACAVILGSYLQRAMGLGEALLVIIGVLVAIVVLILTTVFTHPLVSMSSLTSVLLVLAVGMVAVRVLYPKLGLTKAAPLVDDDRVNED